MEIGSIYELNPGAFESGLTKSAEPLKLGEAEKYDKKHIRYTASGREAIALALKSFEKEHPVASKRCLLPAYMCDCVYFPFERAGWELHFYHVDRKLEANIDELDKLIGQTGPELIFIHPYYGVDTWRSVRPFFRRWRAQGICIMEDVTQSYYLQNAGKEADYCVGSLRKWYAVPDGGFVASDAALPEDGFAPNEEFVRKKGELLRSKWEYLHGQMDEEKRRALKAEYLQQNRETEAWLDAYDGISVMSEESAAVLSQINEKECEGRRKENCAYLHEHLAEKKQLVPVFGQAYENDKMQRTSECGDITDAAPLYYPVYAADRDEMQKFLALRGVYAPTLWPVGEENTGILSQDERYVYEHILALPIDQRYGIEEMQRVLEVLDQYEAEKSGNVDAGSPIESRRGQMIGIRADANDTVATGHIMRCITIAKKLIAAGSRVLFFTADEYASDMLEQAGMQYVCLHTRWDDMEQELPLLREKLRQAGCDKLLVDSYQVTARYFEGLRDLCRLVYIDDCFEQIYPVDMIINYNAYHVRFPYEEAYAGKAGLLLGTSYVPLREEFGDGGGMSGGLHHNVATGAGCCDDRSEEAADFADRGEVQRDTDGKVHVLLSSGGGDLYNAMAGILRTAVQDEILQKVTFHTVVGGFNRNAEELRELAEKNPNIRLHERVDHMAQLMGACQAAVSAAGTMLFELSAMQTPAVFFVSADNQQYDHEFFAQDGRMLYAGDIREDREGCIRNLCRQLRLLLENEDMRDNMKRKLREVTDGNGAQRIAEELLRI